jgi:hypothetical protein
MKTSRPTPEEYSEYYNQYLNLIKDGDIINILEEQSSYIQKFISSIPEEKGDSTYGFGKWTIKEVFGHLIDTERILTHRILKIVRGDKQPSSGYDQDDYVKKAKYYKRTLKEIADEMLLLRAADLKFFQYFDDEDLMQRGIANDMEFSVRALLYILAGHELYHINFIKENYLV